MMWNVECEFFPSSNPVRFEILSPSQRPRYFSSFWTIHLSRTRQHQESQSSFNFGSIPFLMALGSCSLALVSVSCRDILQHTAPCD